MHYQISEYLSPGNIIIKSVVEQVMVKVKLSLCLTN
jgi:hypothetical protein